MACGRRDPYTGLVQPTHTPQLQVACVASNTQCSAASKYPIPSTVVGHVQSPAGTALRLASPSAARHSNHPGSQTNAHQQPGNGNGLPQHKYAMQGKGL